MMIPNAETPPAACWCLISSRIGLEMIAAVLSQSQIARSKFSLKDSSFDSPIG
jgi:hypothetical protein